nr:MAG TPA: hypothetical protein [Caudoviricetes sp.]
MEVRCEVRCFDTVPHQAARASLARSRTTGTSRFDGGAV